MVNTTSSSKLLGYLSEFETVFNSAKTIWIGYSGGLDSTVLLHLMKTAGMPIRALHVNHQLSVNAKMWEEHCCLNAKNWNIPFISESVSVQEIGRGLEAAARDARQQVFKKYVADDDVLCLAHHADDQLETLIFRLMRGTGLKGLAGIAEERRLNQSNHDSARVVRPLLLSTRKELLAYALENNVQWVEDESNEKAVFDRNYIRESITPLLRDRWPECARQAAKSAQLLRANQMLLEEYAEEDLIRCELRQERLGESLSLREFMALSQMRRQHLIRYWVEKLGFSLPSQTHLLSLTQLFDAKEDAEPEVCWGQCVFRRYQQRLYLHKHFPWPQGVASLAGLTLNSLGEMSLPLGKIRVETGAGLVAGEYTIQFRKGGERCKPAHRRHSQTLKKLFQEYGVEPWLRDVVPLVYSGNEIAAVGDFWVCDGFAQETGWRLQWKMD